MFTLESVALEGMKDEWLDYTVYSRLANSHLGKKRARRNKLGDVFQRLSETEYKHYEFWKKFAPNYTVKVSRLKLYWIMFIEAILGATFAVKFLEKHEESTLAQYKKVESCIPLEDRTKFEEMVKEEQEHEVSLAKEVQSNYIKYMSFIVLGLADAIVEISGIHAGSLGIYKSTELTGLAGIVAGAAASMAMASAAFAQAKQGFQGSATVSAILTGISYFINAVVLASPYFIFKDAITAMFSSLVFAMIILAFTSYYNAIISGAHFVRDFVELAGITLGATVALYLFGELVRAYTGITI